MRTRASSIPRTVAGLTVFESFHQAGAGNRADAAAAGDAVE